jgi:hypothetical protein
LLQALIMIPDENSKTLAAERKLEVPRVFYLLGCVSGHLICCDLKLLCVYVVGYMRV